MLMTELNNTFFIENNSSSDEKNISDDEVISNFDDIEDDTQSFVENFNKIQFKGLDKNARDIVIKGLFYVSVYRDYIQAYKEKHGEEKCVVSETTFRRTWKFLMPSLQFMSPKSDLCEI
ncbi:hypothetical protein C1646_818642 [Rhizophagus diaphanus]|nr:hypothetical protein C1646_818642 [Rhizophagus diaphanus] [Rhizophagus sp. MUCL 43196]